MGLSRGFLEIKKLKIGLIGGMSGGHIQKKEYKLRYLIQVHMLSSSTTLSVESHSTATLERIQMALIS